MAVCPRCQEENPGRAKFCLECGLPLSGRHPDRVRKVVTVVFVDVTGSTALTEQLDPESVRHVLSRYFAAMKNIIEAHGGTVEKFIGDAVMAVFGIPTIHEDDALRAVRAAEQIRRETAGLSRDLERRLGVPVHFRTGVNTGEVVAGDPSSGDGFATGDTVNVAARLEQMAEPGEILLGELTHRLVLHAVVAEPAGRLALKGKADGVPAWRLLEVQPHASEAPGSFVGPLIGRKQEMGRLRDAFARCREENRCQLVTVVGPAGIGKSRLAEEFVAQVKGHARILQSRCPSYGQLTFWPVQEALKEAAGIAADDSRDVARKKLNQLLPEGEEAALVIERVSQVVGLSQTPAPTQEIFWGIRKLLQAMAARKPLVLVLDDLHWAEPVLLDLVEYLCGSMEGSAVLLICPARSRPARHPALVGQCRRRFPAGSRAPDRGGERAARRGRPRPDSGTGPAFGDRRRRGQSPLHPGGVATHRRGRPAAQGGRGLGRGGRARPRGDPPTIGALLAARLDRLAPSDRSLLQRASVAGQIQNLFWWGAVCELSPVEDRSAVGGCLQTLVRKEFIRPQASTFAGEDAFRFLQILIRDATYQATPKEDRADLHERFAGWLEDRVSGRMAEFDEIIGGHLELAHRLRTELTGGIVDEHGRELAERAAGHLATAGRRALDREDAGSAAGLLERAASLWTEDHPARLETLPDLGFALFRTGANHRAQTLLVEAADRAAAAGQASLEHRALLALARVRLFTSPEGSFVPARRTAENAIAFFGAGGDDAGLAQAYALLATFHAFQGQESAAEEALERALEHETAIGGRNLARLLGRLPWVSLHGARSAPASLQLCTDILTRAQAYPSARCDVQTAQAWLQASVGRFEEARTLLGETQTTLHDLGRPLGVVVPLLQTWGRIEFLAGDTAAAERLLREDCTARQKLGNRTMLANTAAFLAHVLVASDQESEAEDWARLAGKEAASEDLWPQVYSRTALAKLASRRGEWGAAETLARDAVHLARFRQAESPALLADALVDLSDVLRQAGQHDDAAVIAAEALDIYEQKGYLVAAGRLRQERTSAPGR